MNSHGYPTSSPPPADSLFAQPSLKETLRFNGSDYDQKRDGPRLTDQFHRIFDLMKDGKWRSLGEISAATGDPESSVSAQLRHARKPRFGSHTVEKKHEGDGLFLYRLIPSTPTL